MKGVKHYTKDGKEWKGATHKMPNGKLHTGKSHGKNSKPLVHKKDLKKKKTKKA
jgi:hypothetical protein